MNLTALLLDANGTNGTLDTGKDLVSYNCNTESGGVALQAITDAITMAKLVLSIWNLPEYEPILRTYIGDSCVGNETWQNWIQSQSLPSLGKVEPPRW